ncbi:hypothetical protein SCA6_003731 [Theobroma cacao]
MATNTSLSSSSHQKSSQDESNLVAGQQQSPEITPAVEGAEFQTVEVAGQQQSSEITPASNSTAVEGAEFQTVEVEPRASGIKNPSRSLLLTLMKNIYSGDLASVNKFLNNYSYPLTTQLSTSGTALHAATIAGQPKIVELLLNFASEEDVEATNIYGETAMILAALHGNTEIAKCLFKRNKKLVTIVNSEGLTVKKPPASTSAFTYVSGRGQSEGNKSIITQVARKLLGWGSNLLNMFGSFVISFHLEHICVGLSQAWLTSILKPPALAQEPQPFI